MTDTLYFHGGAERCAYCNDFTNYAVQDVAERQSMNVCEDCIDLRRVEFGDVVQDMADAEWWQQCSECGDRYPQLDAEEHCEGCADCIAEEGETALVGVEPCVCGSTSIYETYCCRCQDVVCVAHGGVLDGDVDEGRAVNASLCGSCVAADEAGSSAADGCDDGCMLDVYHGVHRPDCPSRVRQS